MLYLVCNPIKFDHVKIIKVNSSILFVFKEILQAIIKKYKFYNSINK